MWGGCRQDLRGSSSKPLVMGESASRIGLGVFLFHSSKGRMAITGVGVGRGCSTHQPQPRLLRSSQTRRLPSNRGLTGNQDCKFTSAVWTMLLSGRLSFLGLQSRTPRLSSLSDTVCLGQAVDQMDTGHSFLCYCGHLSTRQRECPSTQRQAS